jgi:hypothetical protein
MKEALSTVQDPQMQTQQEQMLEQQTQGFDDTDAQQWRPSSADWGNMRINGAKKIMESGGSLDDVQKFQKYVDDKQKNGIQKYANLAATALEQGNVDAAARYMDVGYGYMDDGVLLQSSNVNGQLMAFPKNEQTGELIDTPVPLSPDAIRRQAQAFTDNDAFLRWSWGKSQFDKEFGLKEDANKRAEELQPGKVRKQDADIAKAEQGERGVISGTKGSTGGTSGGIANAAGWKTTDLNAVQDDIRKTFDSFNLGSQTYAGIPRGKEDIYTPENAPKTHALTYGLVDVNPGISAGTAVVAGEKLAKLRAQGGNALNSKIIKVDPNSPSGFTIKLNNQKFNLPIRLAPDGGAYAEAYFKKKGVTLGGKGGVVDYMKREPLSQTPWYAKKYKLEGGQQAAPPSAIQTPPPSVQPQAAPQQAVPTQQPQAAPQQAVPQQAPPPAPGLRVPTDFQTQAPTQAPPMALMGGSNPNQAGQPLPDEARRMAVATQGGSLQQKGSPRKNSPAQRAIDQAVNAVFDEFMQWQDPSSPGGFDMDQETIKQFETVLRGMHSERADQMRAKLKELKKSRRY